jgi:hypothetical protein
MQVRVVQHGGETIEFESQIKAEQFCTSKNLSFSLISIVEKDLPKIKEINANYTITTADNGYVIDCVNENDIFININSSSLSIGETLEIHQKSKSSHTLVFDSSCVYSDSEGLTSNYGNGFFIKKTSATNYDVILSGNKTINQTDLTKKADKSNYFYVPKGYNLSLLSVVSNKNLVILYDFDLQGSTVTLSTNCTLIFQGGSISNGTITGTSYNIVADKVNIFKNSSVTLAGSLMSNVYPEWWGDRSISNYDWQPALQKALDSAKLSSNKVLLSAYKYQYYNQLTVNEGTTIQGVSRGDTAFGGASIKGSVLHCLGSSLGSTTNQNIAIKVTGRMVNLNNFTIKGERSLTKYGDGIVIYGIGDGSSSQALIENCFFENLLIHGFMKGKGLNLVAGNSGAVTYSNFFNIRLRDCAKHLIIEALSSNPIYNNLGSTGLAYTNINCFINSNNFQGLYISGYCETGIKVYTEYDAVQTNSQNVYRPANNLTFNGVVIEPPYSNNSHIRIEGAGSQVRMHDIRVEASSQDANFPAVPVVYLGDGTNANLIDCDQMSVTIQDLGWNNHIKGHNGKNGNATPNTNNLYKNSALLGLDKSGANVYLPEWTIEEQGIGSGDTYYWRPLTTTSNVLISESSEVVEEGYRTLQVTVPPNYQFRMNQNIDRTLHKIPNGKVNCKIKATNLKDVIWTYQDSETPVVSGGTCFGGNVYEPMGAFFVVTPTTVSSFYRISLFCQNYTASNIVFSFAMPSFVVGEITPSLPARPLTEHGGTVYGVLGFNNVKNILPVSNVNHRGATSSDVILPKEGNYFEINEGGFSIQKINATVNRFERGATITLYFNYSGITIINSSFIALSKPYYSEVGGSITLQSPDGNGLWREISRYSKKLSGLYAGDINTQLATNYLTLDTTCNIFNLTNGVSASTINRINYTSRFDEGFQITLNFTSLTFGVSLVNSAYISLYRGIDFAPVVGDWIKLETTGNGTWTEIARKQSAYAVSKTGYAVLEASTYIATNYLTLPVTGENYFVLNNTSTAQTITRINNAQGTRFEAGQELMLRFDTLTNTISFTNSAYLKLINAGSFIPVVGDWMKLIHQGDGTWIETSRKFSATVPLDLSITLSASYLASTYLTLPLTGENYFKLSAATLGGSIARINNASTKRFAGGWIIMLEFTNVTVAVTLVHSTYLILAGAVNYTPSVNGGIVLFTRGDGTWRELSRF